MELSDLDVLILCGGLGTRLRGVLPEGTPKCMADINGVPFLEILIERLTEQFPRANLKLSAGVGYDRIPLQILAEGGTVEPVPLGTGGAIARAADLEWLKLSDPFFAVNGDTYCELDFAAVLKSHLETGFDITVPYDSQYRHVGTYLLSKKAIRAAAESLGPKFDLDAAFGVFPKKKILVNWYPTDVEYWDIGTPEKLEAFRLFWHETHHT